MAAQERIPLRFVVPAAAAGARLDAFLAEALGVSRRESRRVLARGSVLLDGRPVTEAAKGLALPAGARLEVRGFTPPGARRPAPAPDLELRVLAEGDGWLALAKQAGVPVHPLEPEETGTLLGALAVRRPEILGVGEGGLRSGVVHRLDVDTSGVVLFATETRSWQRLRDAFSAGRIDKRYRALVHGTLHGEGEQSLDLEVARHRPARVRVRAAPNASSRRTQLRWRALAFGAETTLLEVRPRTGFLHQIRVSLAHLGHPVVGDRVYGAGDAAQQVPRQMLHAASLRFDEISAEAQDPGDFAAALTQFRVGNAHFA